MSLSRVQSLLDREYFGMKLGLEKIQTVLKRLDNPEQKFPSIHIAGTNGKGSTATMVARILEAQGYKVGLFTSPHLQHIEERFQIDGRSITTGHLNELTRRIQQIDAKGQDRLSFFEFMTALAFLYFAEESVDIAVVEVGLGGRLDATNVLMPQVSVLTRIAKDHEEHLGSSLEKIAREKGGIIKCGVPVVSAVQNPRVQSLLREMAVSHQAPLQFVSRPKVAADGCFDLSRYRGLWVPGFGDYQAENAAVAIAAVEALPLPISRRAIFRGLAQAHIPGRMEIIRRCPTVLLDTAHNAAALAGLADAVRCLFPGRRVHCLFAAMADKKLPAMLKAMRPMFDKLYVTAPDMKRALAPQNLLQAIVKSGLQGEAFQDVSTALHALLGRMGPQEVLVITGSLFLVGEAKTYFDTLRIAA